MEQKVILRQRPGGGAPEALHEFPVRLYRNITLGREPICEIPFPTGPETVVSRLHCQISAGAGPEKLFLLADLGSSNGTFLNRQRISGSVVISPGDVVQLGPGGPELEFDIEPRPEPRPAPAWEDLADPLAATTPWVDPPKPPHPLSPAASPLIAAAPPPPARWHAVTPLLAALAAGMAIFAGAVAWAVTPRALTPDKIARRSAGAWAQIETRWRLVDAATGSTLYHAAIPNATAIAADGSGVTREIVPDAGAWLPAFLARPDGGREPLLTSVNPAGVFRPVSGTATSYGVLAGEPGELIAPRGALAPWTVPYGFAGGASAVLLDLDAASGKITGVTPMDPTQALGWVPARARFLLLGEIEAGLVKLASSARPVEGRRELCEARAGGETRQIEAVKFKDAADLAVARARPVLAHRASNAEPLLELSDRPTGAAADERLVVLAAPGAAPWVGRARGEASGWELPPLPAGSPVLDDRGRLIAVMGEGGRAIPAREIREP